MNETAEYILNNSDLLIRSDCKIIHNTLYENLSNDTSELNFKHKYRFFKSTDDYDYVEDEQLIRELDKIFSE